MTDLAVVDVTLIEDQPMARRGFSDTVREEPGLNLVGAYETVDAFLAARIARGELVVLDLELEKSSVEGPDAVACLKGLGYKVLVHSVSYEQGTALAVIAAGARGYLTKGSEPAEIFKAIREVAAGRVFFTPTVAGYLLIDKKDRLTDLEVRTLRLLAAGYSTAKIADEEVVTVAAVNSRLERIATKTGGRTRADQVAHAYKQGYLKFWKSAT